MIQKIDKNNPIFNNLLSTIENYQKSFRTKFFFSLLAILPISILLSIVILFFFLQILPKEPKLILNQVIILYLSLQSLSFIILLSILSFYFFNKNFSKYVKQKIMNTIFQNLFLEVSLEKYLSKSKYLSDTIKTIFPYKLDIIDIINDIISKIFFQSIIILEEEDIFVIQYRNIPIVISEIRFLKSSGRYTSTIFQGIVYQIPSKYAKSTVNSIPFEDGQEKPTGTATKLTHNDYLFILVRQNKNSFELPLFKKIDENKLIEFIEEIKEKVEFIINNLETTQNY
ncbi:MAG: hypothetical protein ACK4GR_05285 [bacterium]